ncbi:S1 family peptidase [Arenibacterium sp. CAU 1754]
MRILIALLLFAALLPQSALAQQEHVYRIKASRCMTPPETRVQTGFRVKGWEGGLVTALHGVAGCDHITADRPGSNEEYSDLNDYSIDLKRDLAFVSGASLRGREDGLEWHPRGLPENPNLTVIGFPSSMQDFWEMQVTMESRALFSLEAFVPYEIRIALDQRKSPALDAKVLRLNGNLQPGHSGAPVLDDKGRLVAMGLGGLRDGTVGIGWAMPLRGVEWVRKKDVLSEYYRIASFPPAAVFAQDETRKQEYHSSGTACLGHFRPVDLDAGRVTRDYSASDLFLSVLSNGMFLQPGLNPSPAKFWVLGQIDYDAVSAELASLKGAITGSLTVRGDGAEIGLGSVIIVQTSDGRFAKIQITGLGQKALNFHWATFIKPGDTPTDTRTYIDACGG